MALSASASSLGTDPPTAMSVSTVSPSIAPARRASASSAATRPRSSNAAGRSSVIRCRSASISRSTSPMAFSSACSLSAWSLRQWAYSSSKRRAPNPWIVSSCSSRAQRVRSRSRARTPCLSRQALDDAASEIGSGRNLTSLEARLPVSQRDQQARLPFDRQRLHEHGGGLQAKLVQPGSLAGRRSLQRHAGPLLAERAERALTERQASDAGDRGAGLGDDLELGVARHRDHQPG